MKFKDWDSGSRGIVYYWLAAFLAGLVLGYLAPLAVQCIIVALLCVIAVLCFFSSEYGHAGWLSAGAFAVFALWSLVFGLILIDVLKRLF
jgi:hypothetical protein